MECSVRASGSAFYSAPPGKHDDLVMALSLAVFGCRRLGRPVTLRRNTRSKHVSSLAWT